MKPSAFAAWMTVTTLVSQGASAQSPARTGAIHAEVGLPDASPARFVNVTITTGAAPWQMEGCVANVSGACFATRRVTLTEADRRALRGLLDEVARRQLCEPEGFAPGDPTYSVSTPGHELRGHLPARAADIPTRAAGPCGAPARLAWWIARRFTAG